MKLRYSAIAVFMMLAFVTSVLGQQKPVKITVTMFEEEKSGGNQPVPQLVFELPPYGQTLAIRNNAVQGIITNNGQGYIFSDDPANPSPGLNEEIVLHVSWLSPQTFELWTSLEKIYTPTFADLYPRGFGPEIFLRVTVQTVNGKATLQVENRQTLMGFLHINAAGTTQEMPNSYKKRNLPGHTWNPADAYVSWGVQPTATQYVGMRMTRGTSTVDFIKLSVLE